MKIELSLQRRASNVHETLARVANPVSLTAIDSLGAHPDQRCFLGIYLVVEQVVSWGHFGSNLGGLGGMLASS